MSEQTEPVQRGKSKIKPLFDEWLTLMEKAYDILTFAEFRKLEDKIKDEIRAHHRRQS
jgi:predicted nucleotide-binding protein (sugar kinase/HSP70/actin superfamily)